MAISVFGQLEKIDKFAELSYKNKGTIIRFLKSAGSLAVSALLVAATGGTLFPVEWSPAVIIVLTAGLQAADKWFRENAVEKEAAQELEDHPLTDTTDDVGEGVGVNEDGTFDSEERSETEAIEGAETPEETELLEEDTSGEE